MAVTKLKQVCLVPRNKQQVPSVQTALSARRTTKTIQGPVTLRYSPLILTFNNSVFSLESTCHFQVILRTNSNCKRFSDLHDGHCIHENFEF